MVVVGGEGCLLMFLRSHEWAIGDLLVCVFKVHLTPNFFITLVLVLRYPIENRSNRHKTRCCHRLYLLLEIHGKKLDHDAKETKNMPLETYKLHTHVIPGFRTNARGPAN